MTTSNIEAKKIKTPVRINLSDYPEICVIAKDDRDEYKAAGDNLVQRIVSETGIRLEIWIDTVSLDAGKFPFLKVGSVLNGVDDGFENTIAYLQFLKDKGQISEELLVQPS